MVFPKRASPIHSYYKTQLYKYWRGPEGGSPYFIFLLNDTTHTYTWKKKNVNLILKV